MVKKEKSGCPPQPNRPKRFRRIGDKIALETPDTPSLKDLSDLVKEIEAKTDPGKLAEEKIKQRARERRRKDLITKTLKDKARKAQKFEARKYNSDADAFDTKYRDGSNRSFWGIPITNGIIQYGDIVRGFHTPTEVYGLIDAMPKGRDFKINPVKPRPTVKQGKKVYPCTVAFLYSKLKPTQEVLTDNGATDITSYDYSDALVYSGVAANGFRQRFDDFGDYETAADAIANNIKESRKTRPGAGPGAGGGGDNSAWPSGTADAITVWYYLGNPGSAFVGGKIFKVSGTPLHPSAGGVTTGGPGVCMEVYSNGSISSAIWPNEPIGQGPLTKKLKESFPELGGKIGYAGDISTWHGLDDYASTSYVNYLRNAPSPGETIITPSSYPLWWTPANGVPWTVMTGGNFYQFGWTNSPMYFGCASTSWINVNTSALSVACGGAVAGSQWYWGGSPTTPSRGVIDKNGVNGYIGIQGMYVCWQGHKDNAGLAQSFFEAFRTYWGIPGSVTYLGSANPYGCGGAAPNGGGGYPPAPVGPARFLIQTLGKKAEIWLKVCRQEDTPIEIKLPFEYVAVVEKMRVLGGATFPSPLSAERFVIETIGGQIGSREGGCDLIHSTLNIDATYAYVDILFGVEREWENPLSLAIPCKLLNLGAGATSGLTWYRMPTWKQELAVGEWKSPTQTLLLPRIIKDSFSYCQSYKIKLPTETDKTLSIVGSQRYKRPEAITLTAAAPDNEFNQKYLVCDFRTERREDIPPPAGLPTSIAPWQNPQPYFASFGGLPALVQGLGNWGYSVGTYRSMVYDAEWYYKSPNDWTPLEYIHFELMEKPQRFWAADTTFPTNVYSATNGGIKFNLDGKFQRQGRSEQMISPSPFGYPSAQVVQQYGQTQSMGGSAYNFPLAISFKEQLIGNGTIENDSLTRWYRIATSSLPLFGQMARNP